MAGPPPSLSETGTYIYIYINICIKAIHFSKAYENASPFSLHIVK